MSIGTAEVFEKNLLEGKTIIVTGGGSGLGRSMATRYAELGANVVLASRSQERLEAAASEMKEATGAEILTVPTNVKQHEEVAHMVERTVEVFGSVDGLLNNAAGNFLCPTEDLSVGGFDAVVDIVMRGSFFATQEVGKRMIAQGTGGSILSILTTYVFSGSAFVVPSAMAKAGLWAMTTSLAVEWGSAYGIRVNAIAPGPFPTEGAWSRLMAGNLEEEAKKRIPFGRFGEHHELANLAAFLMSDRVGFINGECVTIDGGGTLQGAGEMNAYVNIPRDDLRQMLQAMRPAKKA